MKIKWLGTASLLLESGGTEILFDPYLRPFSKKLPPYPMNAVTHVQGIFITHPHFDHFIDLPEVLRHTACPAYVNARGIQTAKEQGYDRTRLRQIAPGDSVAIGGMKITAYPGRHVQFDKLKFITTMARCYLVNRRQLRQLLAQNRAYPIDLEKDILAFHVEAENKSVLILGSAGIAAETTYPAVDMLVYPYQGRSDICSYSFRIIRELHAPVVFFDHIDDAFPPVSSRMDTRGITKKLKDRTAITPGENMWYEV